MRKDEFRRSERIVQRKDAIRVMPIEREECAVAQRAAQAGVDVVMRYFRDGVTMRSKESYNLVSDADVDAEHAIVGVIREAYPGHEILGEEEHHADVGAEHLWVIDPIDGTNNFAHHVPHFGVSVAYYHAGEAQCGVVVNPVREEWFAASKGEGAWYNGAR